MQPDIHPKTQEVKVTCSCGNKFSVLSTLDEKKISLDVCNKCHPFYSGKQKIVDTRGRVEKYKQRYKIPSAKTKKESEQSSDEK